jgi:LacI family transcriptional regulator, galactose operon repressor
MQKRRSLAMNLNAVAQKAGVSTSTVSRVLNNLEIVKSSTRSRVLKVAEELNYHPNLHARSLARGMSRILGIIVSNLENPFFLDIYRTLESNAHARGFEAVVANTDYQSAQLVASVQLMIGLRVAGLAVIVSEMDEQLIQTVANSRIPAAFYDVGTPQKNITNIRVDYRNGIKKTVSYLSSLGHRRMAFIGHHSTLGPISERRKAFLESVHRCSPAPETRIFAASDGLDGGREAARELLESGFRPTAILCVNDFMAVGVMRELHEEGLQIPRDVSVTGFDNIKLAEFCSPPLTTVHIPREQIGHIIFEHVLGNDRNEHSSREIVIDPELVVRDSTGVAKG